MEGSWSQSNTADPDNDYLYNGKELQDDFGLGWYDYGARMYDPTIGVFTGTDRFADKYSNMTPYQYGGNNPIKYIDVNGDSLQVYFQNTQAQNAFVNIVNTGLEGQFETNISDNGIVSFVATEGGGDVSKLSKHGQEFYNRVGKVVDSKGVVNINVDYANSNVHTGRFDIETIDMADVQQFNENVSELGGTQLGKITHEVVEQYHKQLGRSKFNSAHSSAILAENAVNQSRRFDPPNKQLLNTGVQQYSRNGRTVTNRIGLTKAGGWFDLFTIDRKIIDVIKR